MGKATFVFPGKTKRLFSTKQSQLSPYEMETREGSIERDNSRTEYFSGGKLCHVGTELSASVCLSDAPV